MLLGLSKFTAYHSLCVGQQRIVAVPGLNVKLAERLGVGGLQARGLALALGALVGGRRAGLHSSAQTQQMPHHLSILLLSLERTFGAHSGIALEQGEFVAAQHQWGGRALLARHPGGSDAQQTRCTYASFRMPSFVTIWIVSRSLARRPCDAEGADRGGAVCCWVCRFPNKDSSCE